MKFKLKQFFLVLGYVFVFIQQFSFAGPKLPFFVPPYIQPYLAPSFYLLPEQNDVSRVRSLTEKQIRDVLNESLGGEGKRVRPLLVFLAGGLVGLSPRELLKFARLAEFTHEASLIHDDVIDEDDYRRGRETIRGRFGNRRAVLFGNYLLAELTKVGETTSESRKIVTQLMNIIQGMLLGETIQGKAIDEIKNFDLKTYREIILTKTGLIFEWAMVSPLMLLGKKPNFIQDRFSAFALALGELYQRWDDLDPNDYSKNEVNIVRYYAAKETGLSPITGNFSKSQLEAAQIKALQQLQKLARKVKTELLASMVGGARGRISSRSRINRHEECARSLAELVTFLSVPVTR